MATAPTLNSVQYSSAATNGGADSLFLWWNANGGTSFTARITDVDAGTYTDYPGLTGPFATLAPDLEVYNSYTVMMITVESGSKGLYGPAVPIITLAPAMTLLANDTTSLEVAWKPYDENTYAVTFQLGETSETVTTSATSLTYPVTEPMTGANNTVGVQVSETLVSDGVTTVTSGPSSTYAVITSGVGLKMIDNSDSAVLTVGWNDVTGAAAYLATLSGTDGTAEDADTTGLTTAFPGPFTAGVSYSVTVSVTSADGVSIGPGTSHAAITTAPTMVSVVNSGGGVTLTWEPLAGCSYFMTTLTAPDGSDSVKFGYGPSLTYNGTLTQTGYRCDVAGMTSDQVALGPASPAYIVIIGSPLWQLIAYDADILDLTWSVVTDPGVDSYQIEIAGLTPTDSFTSAGTGTNTSIAASLTPMVRYPTTVRAADGISLGPSSPALIPLTAPPVTPALGYTGTALQLSWQASGESGVTGYGATLLANGGTVESANIAASPELFTTAFAAATAYLGRVRSAGDATLGPWADAAGPYQSVRTYMFDALGRIGSVEWQDAFTETYDFDTAGNLRQVQYAAATSATAATGSEG